MSDYTEKSSPRVPIFHTDVFITCFIPTNITVNDKCHGMWRTAHIHAPLRKNPSDFKELRIT